MKTEAQMRSFVMRRVYLTYCYRQVCKPVPRLAIFMVLGLALVGSVSIVNVVSNALNTTSVWGLANFAFIAFMSTDVVVQVLSVGLAAMIGWAALDTARKLQFHIEPVQQTTH